MRFGGGGRHRVSLPTPLPPRPPQPPPQRRGAAAGTARRRPARPGRCPSPAGVPAAALATCPRTRRRRSLPPPPLTAPLLIGRGPRSCGLPTPPRSSSPAPQPHPPSPRPPSLPPGESTSPGAPHLSPRLPGAPRLSCASLALPFPASILWTRMPPRPSARTCLPTPPAPTVVLPHLNHRHPELSSLLPILGRVPLPGQRPTRRWCPPPPPRRARIALPSRSPLAQAPASAVLGQVLLFLIPFPSALLSPSAS